MKNDFAIGKRGAIRHFSGRLGTGRYGRNRIRKPVLYPAELRGQRDPQHSNQKFSGKHVRGLRELPQTRSTSKLVFPNCEQVLRLRRSPGPRGSCVADQFTDWRCEPKRCEGWALPG
jgi:hypothetical protein